MSKMLRKYLILNSVILLASAIVWSGCRDIFEIDLTEKKISILAPTDNFNTTVVTQTFWWEEVEGALEYNIQIVSPSFSSIQMLVLDSIVTDNIFTYTLLPGTYQWRVKASNGSSNTDYTTHTLVIDTTSDLSGQIITLQSPSNGSYFNSLSQTFTWNSLYNATGYDIQIATPDFSNSANTILDTNISSNSLQLTLDTEGEYQWKVRATNSSGYSPYSQVSDFEIDITAPNTPLLVLPIANDTSNNPFSLHWDRGTVTGSPITDTVYLYTDSITTLFYKEEKNSTSHTDSIAVGNYFWRVRSVDKAGNLSAYSETRKLTIE